MTGLDATLATLRRHGVQTYEGPDLKVTFFDRPGDVAPATRTNPLAPDDDEHRLCACGHEAGEHNNGACLACPCAEERYGR